MVELEPTIEKSCNTKGLHGQPDFYRPKQTVDSSENREGFFVPLRFAYADPPYLYCASRLYGDPTYDSLDAHAELINSLQQYDGWAYSLNSTTLREILPLCPPDVRIAAWVKPFCSFKPNVNPAYTWEPVIFKGGRKRERYDDTVRDYVAANITLKKGLAGAKPKEFCYWIFDLLNMRAGDEFIDVFPGTGGVMDAWLEYSRTPTVQLELI